MTDTTQGQDAAPQRLTRRDLMEGNVEKVQALARIDAQPSVSPTTGTLVFRSPLEIMETAKMMATAGPALPQWLQGNPGGCWAIIMQANEWGMFPLAVARQSYVVNGVVGYMSQLVHALIETRAPLLERLKSRFEGEGDERRCIVYARVRGEEKPLEWSSPPFGKITPKNSPLWKSDPDQQQFYYTSRTWTRRWFPDIMLGIYTPEELSDSRYAAVRELGNQAKDVTPAYETAAEGFHPHRIEASLAGTPQGSADELANIVSDVEIQEPAKTQEGTNNLERATVRESTTESERATATESAQTDERAKDPEKTKSDERATAVESTTVAERAKQTEETITQERAIAAERTQTEERAGDEDALPEFPAFTLEQAEQSLATAKALYERKRISTVEYQRIAGKLGGRISVLKGGNGNGKHKTLAPSAEPAAAAEVAPKEPAPKEVMPKNAEQYVEYARAWIEKAKDDGYLDDRWREEKKLRTACSVTGEHFDAIFKAFQEKLDKLQG